MTALPNLVILDVGHGNCAVLHDTRGVVIFDGGAGGTLHEYLQSQNVTEVLAILLSHADTDHIDGVNEVLLSPEIVVKTLYVNSDTPRNTNAWCQLRRAIRIARERNGTVAHSELNTSLNGTLPNGDILVQVLAPQPEDTLGGPGGRDLDGNQITANSMSAVICLLKADVSMVLLPGDLDGQGLSALLEDISEPTSQVLVFPHHGGRPGAAKPEDFTDRLCKAVQPNCVIFAIGRNRSGRPRRDIVNRILAILPDATIMCTQLSEHCAPELPINPPPHLNALPASGAFTNSCCAGSILIDLTGSTASLSPSPIAHRDHLAQSLPNNMCLPRLES